jgi:NAD-dependent dihydropyrimidine dehydrogenase PreA subunit
MPPTIDRERCDNCQICYDICPCDVFGLDDGGIVQVYYTDECWHCCACEIDCPQNAIEVELHYMMK